MADSAAERSRRAYRHRRGDHSLCDPARRCEALELIDREIGPVNEDVEPASSSRPRRKRYAPPNGYEHVRGPRGGALWDELAPLLESQPAARVLLDETCRMVDRLDRLDYLLSDRSAWLTTETDEGGRVIVVVDAVLGEARQHATALRALVGDITKQLPKVPDAPKAPRKGGLGDLVALADRRRSSAS